MPVLRSLALFALAGAAMAEDHSNLRRVADLRLIGCSAAEFESAGENVTGRGMRIGVGFFYSFVEEFEGDITGPLIGIEVARLEASDDDFDVAVTAACLHLGLAYQTGFRPVHTELAFLAGVGPASLESNGEGLNESTYHEWGARVGAFWTFPVGLQIGLDARFMRGNVDVKFDGAGRIDLDNHGFTGGVNVGWRF